jgi:hypothetical protein
MAAKPNDFDFSKPLVGSVSRESYRNLVAIGKGSPRPTAALRALMSGKPLKK